MVILKHYLFLFLISLFAAPQLLAQDCPDGRMAISQDKTSRVIAGPRLGKIGAIWYYKIFEVGRMYRFCVDPVVDAGREPNYRQYHDNMVVETLPPPAAPGADIYMALIDPMGRKFVEPEEHFSPSRGLRVKYRNRGTWILEFMVRDGWNEYGLAVTEDYNGYKLRAGNNFIRMPE